MCWLFPSLDKRNHPLRRETIKIPFKFFSPFRLSPPRTTIIKLSHFFPLWERKSRRFRSTSLFCHGKGGEKRRRRLLEKHPFFPTSSARRFLDPIIDLLPHPRPYFSPKLRLTVLSHVLAALHFFSVPAVTSFLWESGDNGGGRKY